MTAQNEKAKELFREQRIFMPQCTDSLGPVMVLGPDKKLGIIRDTTFQPFKTRQEVFEVRLEKPAKEVSIQLRLIYVLRPKDEILIHDWKGKVPVVRLFPR